MSCSAMSTTEAARASSPALEDTTKEPRQRKGKKNRTEESRSHHHHRHGQSKKSKAVDAPVASSTSATHRSEAAAAEEGEEDWEENRAAVERLCAQYPNNICCDCGESGTRWAAVNFGVFVCIRCSGVHRSLGTHVSKVKSTNMDRWALAEARLMEAVGNAKGKTLYEARLPAGTRPSASSSSSGSVADEALKSFIRRKYAEREFAMHNLKDVLGRLYKDTGYGRPPKKSLRPGEAPASVSGNRDDAPIDRAVISGKRGDTMRALYGDAAEEMQRGAARRKKGGNGGASNSGDAVAAAAPKPTYGAFGLVNVPADDYQERWRRTVAAFAHVEAADAASLSPDVDGDVDPTPPPPAVATDPAEASEEESVVATAAL